MKKHVMKEQTETLFTRFLSPVGELLLVGTARGEPPVALSGVYFTAAAHAADLPPEGGREDAGAFVEVLAQLCDYFAGRRTTFDLLLAPRGTAFQRDVWNALSAIPYGETTTYAAIAHKVGRPKAGRAVGAANGRNPLSIVVPCHRVIGGNGALTGYAGGLPQKQALLALERAVGLE